MPTYLVESYLADADGAVAEEQVRARLAAELGLDVRYLRTTFLPTDETILHVFEAPSAEALAEAGARAQLRFGRIVEAVEGAAGPAEEPA